MAPFRRTMLVLRARDEPDPSREGAGVLRGLDMLPAEAVGSAQEQCLKEQSVQVLHAGLRTRGLMHRFGVGCESQQEGEVKRP